MTVSGGAKLRLVDADSPQRSSGPHGPATEGAGRVPTRRPRRPNQLTREQARTGRQASRRRQHGLRPGHRARGGAVPAGNPAPEEPARSRAPGKTVGAPSGAAARERSGDGQFGSKRLASCSSECETGSQRVRKARRAERRGNRDGRRTRDTKPHEWQRPSRSHSGRGVNRRGGGKPRGRNVPGEASPGEADPVAHVVVGAPNSTRGIRRASARWIGGEAGTLRGRPKPVGVVADACMRDRTDDGTPRGRRDDEEGAVNQ